MSLICVGRPSLWKAMSKRARTPYRPLFESFTRVI
jgi:hypothetical protein